MMTIETVLVDILEAAKANDEERFNNAFEDLARIARRGNSFITGVKVAAIMGFTTEKIHPYGERVKRREHIGTRMFGRNFAVMTVNPGDTSAWILKEYGGKDEEIGSYMLTR